MPSEHPGKLNGESPSFGGALIIQPIQCSAEVSYLLTKAMAAFIFLCEHRPEGKKELNRSCWKLKGGLNVVITRRNIGDAERGTTALLVLPYLVL